MASAPRGRYREWGERGAGTRATEMSSTAFLEFDDGLTVDIRLSELEARLERERGRCSGLENGLSALSERVTVLREENARLRERLALAGIDAD